MVFSSIPAYLDPSNWHQQQNHQSTSTNPLLPPPPPYLGPQRPPPHQPHGVGGPGSIRPGSMSEQARMANMPMSETNVKCPRCDSTNTKFCYYNNYNLSQPRHFCKSCRRYWTRGGALRSVPVGGGCRRNKRSKSTSSKSSVNRSDGQTTSGSTSSMSTNSGATILGLTPPQLTPLRFMSPLSQLSENFPNELGLNYGGISGPMVGTSEMNFHNNLFGGGLLSSGGSGIDTWRMQQSFPFLGGLDNSNLNGIYQFHQGENGFMGGGGEGSNQLHVRPKFSSSMLTQQITPSVKMEENPAEMNNSRQLLGGGVTTAGNNNINDQWNINSGGGAPNWTHLSSFNSSSTSNALWKSS